MSGTFDQTIRTFLEEAGAAVPTPGGGSVAALAGALGAAMVSMTAGFTKGEKFAEAEAIMMAGMSRMKAAIRDCEDLLEADIASFNRYMRAVRLPKASDEDKLARVHALHEAALQAIEVPLRLMGVCRDALATAEALAGAANPNVISDLGIGALLFEAAAQSAYLTVEINLASLKDEAARMDYSSAADELRTECAAMKERTIAIVRGIIGGSAGP